MNFLSWFGSSAPGITLDGSNTRCLGPLTLHGRNNLPVLSVRQIRLIKYFTWLNHILILYVGEKSHRIILLPRVRWSQKETAPQLLVANQEHLTLPLPMKGGECIQPVGAQRGFHHSCHWMKQVLPCVQEMGIAHTLPPCSKLLGQGNTVILTFAAAKYTRNLSGA